MNEPADVSSEPPLSFSPPLKEEPPLPVSGLIRALINTGKLNESKARELHSKSESGSGSIITQLIDDGIISGREIAVFASRTFSVPMLDLDHYEASHVDTEGLDILQLIKQDILPIFKRGKQTWVAVSDPSNLAPLEALRFQTNQAINQIVVENEKLQALFEELQHGAEASLQDEMHEVSLDELLADTSDEELETQSEDAKAAEEAIDDSPIVKLIRKILVDAINDGASDIHFEPYENFYRIRFRIDGELAEVMQPPRVVKDKLASRIKVMSRLNIAEKRIPQDGRTKIILSRSKTIDFRVSTLPTLHGEKIVMRILDSSAASLNIDALGYEPEQQRLLLEAVMRPYGMVLVTGPTGSGKTVSLYSCINLINKPDINISTAEDPAEINLAGVNQVNVDDRAGLTFSAALKSFLRQDPDVIMVGEIRDLETAEIAIKAAQTGHMVLSTLHTNDAPQTLTRLMNMGVPVFNIASSVSLITAQRLARRLCNCKIKMEKIPAPAMIEAGFSQEEAESDLTTLYAPGGCERCKGSGYKGRLGIYQVMPVSEDMQRIILANGTSMDIQKQSEQEGVNGLRRSGLNKVLLGLTSLEEVLACTND